MMTMKPDELRQLRVWAVETALGKAALSRGDAPIPLLMTEVLADARKLVNFVRANG